MSRIPTGRSLQRAMWLVVLSVGAIGLGTMLVLVVLSNSIRANVDENTSELVAEQRGADQIVSAVHAEQLAAYRYIHSPRPDVLAEFRGHGVEAYAGIRQYLFRGMPLSSRMKVEAIKEAHQQFEVAAQHAFDLALGGEPGAARARLNALDGDAATLESAVREFIDERVQQRGLLRARQVGILRRLQAAEVLVALGLVAAALLLAAVFRRRVMAPLADLADAVHRLQTGAARHPVRVAPQRYREFQALGDDFDRMAETLRSARAEVESRNQEITGAMQELHGALSLLRATLESTADGVLVVDRADKVVLWNRRFAELWRLPDHLLASGDDRRLLDYAMQQLSDPAAFMARVRELYDDPVAESFDVLPFSDGRVFERVSKPQRVAGETIGRVWCFRDVTEQRKLEQQIQQSQKIEAVGTLAGGIAHDFNNLLMVIRLHSQFLQEDLPARSQAQEELAEIVRAADRAATLTRQLLAFSRKQMLLPEVLDIGKVATSLEPMLRRLVGEAITMTVVPGASVGLVKADPGQLEQVIVNLAVNARDAMPDGGQLTIELGDAELDQDTDIVAQGHCRPGRYVVLTFADTGIGMPREVVDRIFEPFFTTKPVGKGSGLGLPMAYGIVKQSGGHITVHSTVGVGTTFRVYLPAARDIREELSRPAARSAAPTTPSGGCETILLVEDEAPVRHLAQRVLERNGYTVLVARHGADAMRLIADPATHVDIVLTDVVMPEMGGPELVRRVREIHPGIPVVFMSGYTAQEIGAESLTQIGAHLLQKPFGSADLSAAVRVALDSRAAAV